MTDIQIEEAYAGEHVKEFAARILVIASATNNVVLGEFNQHTLEARKDMSIEDILQPYEQSVRASYS